jgi:hypothetical protein
MGMLFVLQVPTPNFCFSTARYETMEGHLLLLEKCQGYLNINGLEGRPLSSERDDHLEFQEKVETQANCGQDSNDGVT